MTYRHNIFFTNKRDTTYECLRELLVTVAAACHSVVKKIGVFTQVYKYFTTGCPTRLHSLLLIKLCNSSVHFYNSITKKCMLLFSMNFHDFPGPLLFSMTFQDQWSPWRDCSMQKSQTEHVSIKKTEGNETDKCAYQWSN